MYEYVFKSFSHSVLYAKCTYIESGDLSESGNLCARKCTRNVLHSTFLPLLLFSISFPFLFRVPLHAQALLYHFSIITLLLNATNLFFIRQIKMGKELIKIVAERDNLKQKWGIIIQVRTIIFAVYDFHFKSTVSRSKRNL